MGLLCNKGDTWSISAPWLPHCCADLCDLHFLLIHYIIADYNYAVQHGLIKIDDYIVVSIKWETVPSRHGAIREDRDGVSSGGYNLFGTQQQ